MQVGQFAVLQVVRQRKDCALLEWGQPELLPLPTEEQLGRVSRGDRVVVFITKDDRVFSRPMATMRFREHFRQDVSELTPNQEVELIILAENDLGYDAVVDRQYKGLLYSNEVFGEVGYGDQLTGYIKKIREDGKIDLMTQLRGTRGTTDLGRNILEELEACGGFLPLTDKSPPEEIYERFGVSKKKFKMAIGRLFKHQNIDLEPEGIRLLKGRTD